MKAFTIPSVYKVIDQFTAPIRKMAAAHTQFAQGFESGLARAERVTRKLTPAFSETTKQIFAMAKAAALAGLILGGISFSVKSLMDYENGLQSFRTIVSSLTDKEFKAYEQAALAVGKVTKKSAIDVLSAFEMIAGLNAEFAKTPQAISDVTTAAITLSKASGDDLGKSAANLTGILNQFNETADKSNKIINVLAAGQAVGGSTITQTADALTVYGAIAKSSNITIERSVALTEVLASKQIFASEAGTALRGSTLALQKAGLGYQSGVFDIVGALNEYNSKLDKLKTQKQKDAYATKVFGVINRTAGNILADNVTQLLAYEKAVTGTNEAQLAAAIKSNTLSIKLDELKAAWVNILVSSSDAGSSLNYAKKIIGFLSNNMQRIVSIGGKILIFFLAWKAILLVSRVALIAYNIALGITGALSGRASIAIGANAVALGAYKAALWIATAAQWALNVALTANPIGIIIVAIAALIAIVTVMIIKWKEWGAALSLSLGPLGTVISMVMSFRENWDMIGESFKSGGILRGIMAIGKTFLEAILIPIQQLAQIIANFTGAQWAQSAVKNIDMIKQAMDAEFAPKVNPQAARQEGLASRMETVQQQNVGITINDKTGRAEVDPGNNLIPIKLSSTLAFN